MRGKTTLLFAVTNDTLADQRMNKICTALSDIGYKVVLIGVQKNRKLRPNKKYKTYLLPVFIKKGPGFYLEYNIRLFLFLLFNRWDIITGIDLDSIPACNLASLIKNKKLCFDAHEFYIHVPELDNKSIRKGIWWLIEKIFVRRLTLAYTVNDTLAAIFTERYNKSFSTIKNIPQIDHNLKAKTIKEKDTYKLIYQGAINKGRGLDIYIEAMDSLPQCSLVIYGNGDLEIEIKDLILNSSSKNRIKFEGFVPPEKLRKLTSLSDIGLNMLDPMSISYKYSLANRYFDYINAGLPSIHMDFPEYRNHEQKIQTSILLQGYTSDDMVTAVRKLIDNPNVYEQLSKNCLEVQSIYNWENESKKLIEMYDLL
jgi:glycosyltransferase involved in cell wall biosynthesis